MNKTSKKTDEKGIALYEGIKEFGDCIEYHLEKPNELMSIINFADANGFERNCEWVIGNDFVFAIIIVGESETYLPVLKILEFNTVNMLNIKVLISNLKQLTERYLNTKNSINEVRMDLGLFTNDLHTKNVVSIKNGKKLH